MAKSVNNNDVNTIESHFEADVENPDFKLRDNISVIVGRLQNEFTLLPQYILEGLFSRFAQNWQRANP